MAKCGVKTREIYQKKTDSGLFMWKSSTTNVPIPSCVFGQRDSTRCKLKSNHAQWLTSIYLCVDKAVSWGHKCLVLTEELPRKMFLSDKKLWCAMTLIIVSLLSNYSIPLSLKSPNGTELASPTPPHLSKVFVNILNTCSINDKFAHKTL